MLMACLLQEGSVVRFADAIKADLPAKAVERSILVLEHRCQQVLLAPGEDVCNVGGTLGGMPNRALHGQLGRHWLESSQLLKLVQHDHDPIP